MASAEEISSVETEDQYVHVRFRDSEDFDAIRTPDWAQNVAESVEPGSEVRTGHDREGEDWSVQSVLVPRDVGQDAARDAALEMVRKLRD